MTAGNSSGPGLPAVAAHRVAEFARATWLSLGQVAREVGGRVTAFSLTQAEDDAVLAEAEVVTGCGERYRRRHQVWPATDEAPVEIAVSLFVTAIEEDIRTGGNTTAQRLAAARRVLERHRAAGDDPDAQPGLAAAVLHLATRLLPAQQWDEALAAADEAITRYRDLRERDPGRYAAPLATALAMRASVLERLGRHAEAAEIRRTLPGPTAPHDGRQPPR